MTSHQSRRKFLLLSGSSVGAIAIATSDAPAQSLSEIRQNLVELFQRAVDFAEEALAEIVGLFSDDKRPNPEAADVALRKCIQQFKDAPKDSTLRSAVRVEQLDLFDEIQEFDIELNPAEISLEEPQNIENIVDPEDFGDLVFDILLDTLKLDRNLRSKFVKASDKLGIRGLLKELGDAIRAERWGRAERIARRLCSKLFGKAGRMVLRETLDSTAQRQLLRAVASRAVPFLGWALLAVSFVISLYNNRNRIIEMLQK